MKRPLTSNFTKILITVYDNDNKCIYDIMYNKLCYKSKWTKLGTAWQLLAKASSIELKQKNLSYSLSAEDGRTKETST
jgi:hypothetical protein